MHHRDTVHGYGYALVALAGIWRGDRLPKHCGNDTCVIDASTPSATASQQSRVPLQLTTIGNQHLPKIMLKTFPPMMGATEVQPQFWLKWAAC